MKLALARSAARTAALVFVNGFQAASDALKEPPGEGRGAGRRRGAGWQATGGVLGGNVRHCFFQINYSIIYYIYTHTITNNSSNLK